MPQTASWNAAHRRPPAGSTGPAEPQHLSRLLAVHADATEYYLRQVAGSWVPSYLTDRCLGEALNPAHGLAVGYAPPRWTSLVDHLRDLGYTDATLTESGLALTARTGRLIDRFRDRLVIPLHDGGGRVIAFTARAAPGAPREIPKYVNSPTTALYAKSKHLYGLHAAARLAAAGATPVLVEGPLDAIAVRLAAPGDAAALAQALRAALALDPAQRRAAGAQARAWVQANADVDAETGRMASVIEGLRARRARAAAG
jgi:DNA primase